MAFGLRQQTGLSRKNWRDIWRMIIKRAPKQQRVRQACMLEDLEPRTLMSAVTATALSPTSVELNWTHSAAETGYYVLRSSNGTNFTQIAKLGSSTVTSYTDTTVLSDHTYEYEVEGYLKTSITASPNVATVTTPMIAPTGLTATETSPTSIQLAWTNKDTTTIGYYILRSSNGGSYTEIAQVTSVNTKTYTDRSVSTGTTYSYRVEAYSATATSAVSNTASATTPLFAPTAATTTALTNTSVHITWTDNDSDATGYYVLRATNGVLFTRIATLNSNSADSYTDSSVASAHTYQYEIEAFNAVATSAVSKSVAITTPLAGPTAPPPSLQPASN